MNSKSEYSKNCFAVRLYLDNAIGNQVHTHNRSAIRQHLTLNIIKLPPDIDALMDAILKYEINLNSILDASIFPKQISLIKQDITQIKCDAIVNAANSKGLGCFDPSHACIDNIIHNKAGPNLRLECQHILQGREIATANLIITSAYNLPCNNIVHTVGPIYDKSDHAKCCSQLMRCYFNCLKAAFENKWQSIVFCCVSTGLYGFPAESAAEIATSTARQFVQKYRTAMKIVFCTYTDRDYALYQKLLG